MKDFLPGQICVGVGVGVGVSVRNDWQRQRSQGNAVTNPVVALVPEKHAGMTE